MFTYTFLVIILYPLLALYLQWSGLDERDVSKALLAAAAAFICSGIGLFIVLNWTPSNVSPTITSQFAQQGSEPTHQAQRLKFAAWSLQMVRLLRGPIQPMISKGF